MTPSQIQKILRLIRTSRERVVVLDNASNDVVVMMSLDEYENLPERKKDSRVPLPSDAFSAFGTSLEEEPDNATDAPDSLPSRAEEEQAPLPEAAQTPSAQNLDFSPNWAEHNAVGKEEEIGELPEEPEEQFYLEPVE